MVVLQVSSSFEHEFGPTGLVNPILAPFDTLGATRCDDVDVARGAAICRGGHRRGGRSSSRRTGRAHAALPDQDPNAIRRLYVRKFDIRTRWKERMGLK